MRRLRAVLVPVAVTVTVTVALAGACGPAPASRKAALQAPLTAATTGPAAPGLRHLRMPAGRPLQVVLYGDSVAYEARNPFAAALGATGRVEVSERTFPASAVCDWLPTMGVDAATHSVDAAVLVFTGAWYTACMKDPRTAEALAGDALLDKFEADTRTAVTLYTRAGIHVFLGLEPLPNRDLRADPAQLQARFLAIAASMPGVSVIHADAAVEGPGGAYVTTLPCAPFEPCSGQDASGRPVVVVRGPDGIHFCPVLHDSWECPVWSSGAARYGAALADGIIQAYGLRS